MRLHRKKAFRTLRALPALLLALLLCACSLTSDPSASGQDVTLPVIGIHDLIPGGMTESTSGGTETPAENTDTEAEVTTTADTGETGQSEESTTAPTETTEEPTEAPTETTEEPTEASTEAPSKGIRVWIGDSRFVGIRDTVSYDRERDYFIAGWGVAYYWMINTAIPELNSLAAKHKIDVVYWSLGASDITKSLSEQNYQSAAKYGAELNKLIEKYPDTTFYVISYGPVGGDGKKPSDVSNVDTYNAVLRSYISYVYSHSYAEYINLASYVAGLDYTTSDGRHYDAATNKLIYKYILSQSGQ